MHEAAGRERPEVRPGDPTARITAFFDAALDVVYPYLSRRCGGDRALAEDLTQETFVAAVRTLRRGGVDRLTIGWMTTVAQSRLIDHYRGEARRSRLLRLLPSDGDEARDELEHDVVVRDETTSLLTHLPPDQRLVVVLHHLDDLSVREVAARTGRSERAVESSLARARRTLRRLGSTATEGRDA